VAEAISDDYGGLAGNLLAIEHELAGGDGATYERHLREDVLVVVPGQRFDKETVVAAMDASPGWDDFSIEDERLLRLRADAALLSYRFRGRRGGFLYTAVLSSAYVRSERGDWKLAFHQQTPTQ
jgi:hypothetical protein